MGEGVISGEDNYDDVLAGPGTSGDGTSDSGASCGAGTARGGSSGDFGDCGSGASGISGDGAGDITVGTYADNPLTSPMIVILLLEITEIGEEY